MPGVRKEGQTTQTRARIPGVIKRNTIILALSQALVGAGTQIVPALGPLLSEELLGSAAMAGLGFTIIGVSRLAVSYPMGKIMDLYGRRIGLSLGLAVAVLGTILTGLSVVWHSFPAFVLGLLVFGLGMGAAQQLRLAAADMYPPSRRAEGLGYVLTGSLLGALGGPVIISISQTVSPGLGLSPLATPWLIVPAVIVPTLLLLYFLRPDPKEIGAHLERYYPDYQPEMPTASAENGGVGIRAFLRHYPKLVAIVASSAAWGTMAMVMAMTSLALAHHGHGLPAISLSVSIHVIGMFAFSIPLGRLGDVLGRRSVLAIGTVVTILGTVMVPASPEYWVVTLGTFLVGLGWSCVNVAGTAVLADTTQPQERGRAIGTSDAFASGAGMVLSMIVGPLVVAFGLTSVGILGALVMFVPLPMLMRLRESSPGKYEEAEAVPDVA